MTDEAEPLMHDLALVDPTLADPPPGPGSSRYTSILERALSIEGNENDSGPSRRAEGWKGWRTRALVGVAVAAALIVALIVVKPFGRVPAASATDKLTAAARTTARAESFRVHGVYYGGLTLDGVVSGGDSRSVFKENDPRTGKTSSSVETIIGDREWDTNDGVTTEHPVGSPAERNAPFQIASAAVVTAVLDGSNVTDLGRETIRGQETDHFKIGLTDTSIRALSKLAANKLSAFELEYPGQVASIEIWIAHDLIRKIHVVGKPWVQPQGSTGARNADSTIEFYDFGAHISIHPPK